MAALNKVNTLRVLDVGENAAAPPEAGAEEREKRAGNILIVDPAAARRWHILKVLEDIAGKIHEASSTSAIFRRVWRRRSSSDFHPR